MRRKQHRRDQNHAEVVAAFRAFGWSVLDCSQLGDGAPDLMVAKRGWLLEGEFTPGSRWTQTRHDRVLAVEIKSPTGQLRESQHQFADSWQGESVIVRGVEDVERLSRE